VAGPTEERDATKQTFGREVSRRECRREGPGGEAGGGRGKADLEQSDEVGLCGLLQRQHGAGLEAEVRLEVLSNLTDQPLERQLADEQLR